MALALNLPGVYTRARRRRKDKRRVGTLAWLLWLNENGDRFSPETPVAVFFLCFGAPPIGATRASIGYARWRQRIPCANAPSPLLELLFKQAVPGIRIVLLGIPAILCDTGVVLSPLPAHPTDSKGRSGFLYNRT